MTSTWRKIPLLSCTSALTLIMGCRHQPLLPRDQAKLIKQDEKRLRNWQEPVQAKMKERGASSAMVILNENLGDAPLVFPSSSPLEAAEEHPTEVAAGRACVFVSMRTIPVAPQTLNCSVLVHEAKRVKDAADQLKKTQSDVATTQSDLKKTQNDVQLNSELASLHDHLLQQMEIKVQQLEETQPPKLIATVALRSHWGNVLQSKTSGELHASNTKINQEETWHLYQVGRPEDQRVALQNWRNKGWLVRRGGITANVTPSLGTESTWTILKGPMYGLPEDFVAFRAFDGYYLVANQAGDEAFHSEPGEVWVETPDKGTANPADRKWIGWWQITTTRDDPPGGNDAWNFIPHLLRDWQNNGNVGGTGAIIPAPLACDKLPPIRQSSTVQRVHSHCTFNDFNGPYYPGNEPYAVRRMECDEQAHKQETRHAVIHMNCAVGENTEDCPHVPAP